MSYRQSWTANEDNYLKNLVPETEKVNWAQVASQMNTQFSPKTRTPKQCRERFINYTNFSEVDSQLSKWKPEDIDVLCREFENHGTSWTRIAEHLVGKSENAVKNKFYGTLRKIVRKMNTVISAQLKKKKKKLRYESVIRVIEAANNFLSLDSSLREESMELRKKIFSLVRQFPHELTNNQIVEVSQRINKFNLTTRSFRSKKPKNPTAVGQKQQLSGERCIVIVEGCLKIPEQRTLRQVDYRNISMEMVEGKFECIAQNFEQQNGDQAKIEPKQIKTEELDPLTSPFPQQAHDGRSYINQIDHFLDLHSIFPKDSPIIDDQGLFK